MNAMIKGEFHQIIPNTVRQCTVDHFLKLRRLGGLDFIKAHVIPTEIDTPNIVDILVGNVYTWFYRYTVFNLFSLLYQL